MQSFPKLVNKADVFDEYIVANEEFKIGRDKLMDLSLDYQSVSREHTLISRQGSYWFIKDLNSKYGTFVDGCKICPQKPMRVEMDIELRFSWDIIYDLILPDFTTAPKSCKGIYLDQNKRSLYIDGVELLDYLSPTTFAILSLLRRKLNTAVSYEEIIMANDAIQCKKTVQNQICQINQAIQKLKPGLVLVKNLKGFGYRMDASD